MKELSLTCDVCSDQFTYPPPQVEHRHPELEIGGVPINFWVVNYLLNSSNVVSDPKAEGILKFREMLPLEDVEILSQGEGNTPLRKLEHISSGINVFLKDESTNPTGSFKDRGMPLLIAEAKSLGITKAAIPSTGNAGISFVSYANLAGLEPIVFLPEDTPKDKIEMMREKATLIFDRDLVESYEHFIDYCRKNSDTYNGFPATNVAYIQGLKTAAYEIYMQLNGHAPDWLVLPCGSGGNTVGYYQGFQDLISMGLIDKQPRFVPVQIAGADPITFGFDNNVRDRVPIIAEPTDSRAEAIASDTCFNYFNIVDILDKTKGKAVSVTDEEIERVEGFDEFEFSSLSVLPAFGIIQSDVKQDETVVLVGTAKNRKRNKI